MFYAGIDWSDTKHDIVVISEAGQRVGKRQVAHTAEGLTDLSTFLASVPGLERKEDLACIVETNQGILITTLLEAGFSVFPVNPNTIDHRRNPSKAKTDSIDAYLLAKTGRAESVDTRPGQLDPKPDSFGEPAHGMPQSLLSSRAFPAHQVATTHRAGLLASLLHRPGCSRGIGGTDQSGAHRC